MSPFLVFPFPLPPPPPPPRAPQISTSQPRNRGGSPLNTAPSYPPKLPIRLELPAITLQPLCQTNQCVRSTLLPYLLSPTLNTPPPYPPPIQYQCYTACCPCICFEEPPPVVLEQVPHLTSTDILQNPHTPTPPPFPPSLVPSSGFPPPNSSDPPPRR